VEKHAVHVEEEFIKLFSSEKIEESKRVPVFDFEIN